MDWVAIGIAILLAIVCVLIVKFGDFREHYHR